MSSSQVRWNDADLKKGIANLQAKYPNSVRRSLKRAGDAARAEAGTRISADTALPARKVKDALVVEQVGDRQVNVSATTRRVPLIDFKARGPEPSRGRGRGVSYSLPGGRGRIPNAFIATMPSGHRGVFTRVGRSRVPIDEKSGPSLANVFKKFLTQIETRARETLLANLRHEIDFAAKRR